MLLSCSLKTGVVTTASLCTRTFENCCYPYLLFLSTCQLPTKNDSWLRLVNADGEKCIIRSLINYPSYLVLMLMAYASSMNVKLQGEPPPSDQGNCPSLSLVSPQPWVTGVIVGSHCLPVCRVWSWTSLICISWEFLRNAGPTPGPVDPHSGLTGAGELSGCLLHRHSAHIHTQACAHA